MRSHVYYTHQVLESIKILELVNSWGSLHQERLNGSGYPFGYNGEEVPLGAKIMAVADVFTALTEDRPYRQGMKQSGAQEILKSMSANGELDRKLVNLVLDNYDRLDAVRKSAQRTAFSDYDNFKTLLS
jgi:HD-GYP domain-containing protein (c-di-GMP phosphodiesterase class II)